MKQLINLMCMIAVSILANAQSVQQRLQKAWTTFASDDQLKYAISSLYVIDAKTGEVVFDRNSRVGLAPASTQKVITSVTAFELLGKDYRYKTFFFKGAGGSLFIEGKGDPTFGSERFYQSSPDFILNALDSVKRQKGWGVFPDFFIVDNKSQKSIPSGWIFEDIGNYYGASPQLLNWKENQFDLEFITGNKEGEETTILNKESWWQNKPVNQVKTGKKGSGDNAYVYPVPGSNATVALGTVPVTDGSFKISAAVFNPDDVFGVWFSNQAVRRKLIEDSEYIKTLPQIRHEVRMAQKDNFYVHLSPPLDSIIYWFNKKSINLYGEALLNTFSYAKGGSYQTDSGLVVLKDFWKSKGMDVNELNLHDGSGLSPLNRVTTHAQVDVLKYARSKDWFPLFKNALPEYNGMTMKSGTITDVKGFCGYHTSKSGREYIFSFLVNNYNGKTSPVVMKMYRVLDELK